MRRMFLVTVALALWSSTAPAKKIDKDLQQLGPYRLGASYDEMKNLAGFKLDPNRTKPDESLVAAKIIDKRVADTPTIQRFTFKAGKLIRVSIIFHPPETWSEAAVKAWLIPEWGDPGDKEKVESDLIFLWQARTTTGVLLPADGKRWMASLYYN